MKQCWILVSCLVWITLALPAAVPERGVTLMVRTNGALLAPTNFFNTNAHSVYRGLTNAGYSFGGGSGVGVYGTNGIIGTTQGTVVVFSLYTAPVIDSFVNDINTVEIGSTVTAIDLDWVLSGGAITSQSINQGVGSLAIGLRTYNDTTDTTTNRTYTLTVSDGTTTNTASTAVTLLSKAYWGVSTLTTLSDGQIIALSSEFATGIARSKEITAAAQYIYFAYPASFGEADFTVNGLPNTAWTLVTRAFVNASTYSSSYHIYRSDNLLTGTYTVALQ